MCTPFINNIVEAVSTQVECGNCNKQFPRCISWLHEIVCNTPTDGKLIYVLKLVTNKYYVGITSDLDQRLEDHFNSRGSAWTKKYKPIELVELVQDCDEFDEDKYTLKYMSKYGIENVRGGSFCQVKLNSECVSVINRMIDHAQNKCYKCGEVGHYGIRCEKNNT